MKVFEKIFLAAAIVIVLIIISISFLPPTINEQSIYVKERTFESYSDYFYDYELTRYPSSAEISEPKGWNENVSIGITVDPTNLDFGIVPGNGSYAVRFVNLTNSVQDAKIYMKSYGNISTMIKFIPNNFMLRKNQKIVIDVYFNTSTNNPGIYSGEVDIIIQKPKYGFIF